MKSSLVFALGLSIWWCAFIPQFSPAAAQVTAGNPGAGWAASWATSVQGPDPGANQPLFDPLKLTDATIRQIVHLSAGGTAVRVRFSNAFGTQPLVIDAAHIAIATAADSSAIVPGSDDALTFMGSPGVTIPIGAEFLSDPVNLPAKPLSNLAISFHLPAAPAGQTAHPGSHATSYLLHGNHVGDADLTGAETAVRWFQLAEVDVRAPGTHTVVAFGDSITDGHASTTDGNDRWPDVLAARLQSGGMADTAVVNEGIGGNHLLTNGTGESALERLDRDLLGVAGVRAVLVLEGINDLGALSRQTGTTPADHDALVGHLEAALQQIIERAHAEGIKVFGATVTPDTGSDYYHPNAEDERARQTLNTWIRQPGHFDAVVDFDRVIRDPAHPDRMLPAYDSGDHLHPGPAGYKAMGDAIPLSLLR